jgi:glycerol-1-phosphate dehydrogenase [NAD(P)+]
MPVVDPLDLLIAGRYPDPEADPDADPEADPDGRGLLAAETRSLVIADTLDGAEVELVAALEMGPRLVVISDPDTAAALGRRVERALASRFQVQSVVLDRAPHASDQTLARLLAQVAAVDGVVAVGAGTINDLAKLVAHARGVPQVVFATAPSMNGYTSVSASILEGGVKRSVRTATPVGAFFDLGVLAAAPPRLVRAGLGDSLCRSTAQVDWLLGHLVMGRPYREAPFAMLAADEAALLAEPRALVGGDPTAMRHLVRTLVLSGIGMTLCGGSYPASQGEHLLAHYVTMMGRDLPAVLHGEEIGVCTLAMARLQDAVLGRDTPPVLHASRVDRAQVLRRYGALAGEVCWSELAPKLLDRDGAEALNARLAREWPAIRARLAAVAVGERALRAVLEAAGAPTEPAQLGWPPPLLDDARWHAREIRNRYTFLDLAADASLDW